MNTLMSFIAGVFSLTMNVSCDYKIDKPPAECPQIECQVSCEQNLCTCECECPPEEPTYYSEVEAAVLAPHCAQCHRDASPGGFNMATFEESVKGVVPFAPNSSPMYLEIASGRMPLGQPSLSAQQMLLVQQWIASGALNDLE